MMEICTLPVQNYSCETRARFTQLSTLIKMKFEVQSLGLHQKLIALAKFTQLLGCQHAKNEAPGPPMWGANEHFLVAAN